MKQVTLLTPSYRPDFERFALQRESIERCGIDIPHIAVVHDEDVALFKTVRHQQNLRILSTREVLGASMDRRRRAWQVRRLNYLHWVVRKPVHGWMSQQLVKLAASEWVDTEGIVCLDSDTFFIDRAQHDDFYSDNGKLHLYETDQGLDVEMAGWVARSMEFLGVAQRGHEIKKYVHSPACLHREVLQELRRFVQDKHGKPWMDAFVDSEVFEYSTYGVFARHVHHLKVVQPVTPSLVINYWWPKDVETMDETLLQRVRTGREKAVLIQSNAGRSLQSCRALIEQAWRIRLGNAAIQRALDTAGAT